MNLRGVVSKVTDTRKVDKEGDVKIDVQVIVTVPGYLISSTTRGALYDLQLAEVRMELERVQLLLSENKEPEKPKGPQMDLPMAPDRNTPEGCLYDALHPDDMSFETWNAAREHGLSDEALGLTVESMFEQATTKETEPEGMPYRVRFEPELAIWTARTDRRGKPWLEGPALIAKVREVLHVGQPGEREKGDGAEGEDDIATCGTCRHFSSPEPEQAEDIDFGEAHDGQAEEAV